MTARHRSAALFIASLLIVAAVYMWRLYDLYKCPAVGEEGPDESFAVIKLIVGTALLALGVSAAVAGLRGRLRRSLLWLTCLCALPAVAAWLNWLTTVKTNNCPS